MNWAHGVGRIYESPLPLWLYLAGAAAVVAVSFVIRAFAPERPHDLSERRLLSASAARRITTVLRVVAIVGLGLAIVAGAFNDEGGLTFPLLMLWIVLVVGTTAVSALVAGAWPAIDPWATIERSMRIDSDPDEGRPPPWWLGPALLYLLFWFELVPTWGFEAIGVVGALVLYTVYSLSFRARFGEDWALADPLSLLFGYAAKGAPLRLGDDGVFYRGAISSLDDPNPAPLSVFAGVFILLGSTTLDNVRETVGWSELLDSTGLNAIPDELFDSIALVVLSALFFGTYLLTISIAHRWVGRDLGLMVVARRFAWSLAPIGVAYVLAHNAPLLMTGLPRLIREASDPFGQGWNLLGTAGAFDTYLPSPALVWAIEIFVIVGGHILGVMAAHRIALRLAPDRPSAIHSQYALTALMTVFTVATLWLLSQPLVA